MTDFLHEMNGDYPEDWAEPHWSGKGQYQHTCWTCKNVFFGNKHRRVCKNCAAPDKYEEWTASVNEPTVTIEQRVADVLNLSPCGRKYTENDVMNVRKLLVMFDNLFKVK